MEPLEITIERPGTLTATINRTTGTVTAEFTAGLGGGGITEISTDTDTTVSGLLKGSAGKIAAAVAGTDYAPASHTQAISTVTGLQTALDGKASSTHTHAVSDVTGLQTALDGKQTAGSYAAATHSHAISDVTGLQTALDGKATTSHTHDDRYYTEAETDTALALKVDKVTGKGLSQEDYTTTEKNKLAGIATGATANSSDATLLARANHAGTQAASTISDFQTAVSANTDVTANTTARHTHSNKSTLDLITEAFTTALKSAYDTAASWITTNGANVLTHIASTANPHSVTKAQVGLSDVPNTDATNPANITQSASYRFVTDTEKTTWNAKADKAVTDTGTAIAFDKERIYGEDTALTGNLTVNNATAVLGITAHIRHNQGSAPTFPANWSKLGSGSYTNSVNNIIMARCVYVDSGNTANNRYYYTISQLA